MTIEKAIVLAAGLGTRLRPFTCATPKPLMPVWGEPMLARIVAMLRGWGVEDIVVNCHHLHSQVEQWCAANGCRTSYEPEILGTGGVLNPLREWIGTEPFYLVNGDIVVELGMRNGELGIADGSPLEEVKRKSEEGRSAEGLPFSFEGGADADDVLGWCLTTEAGPRTIEVEPASGFVTNWKSDDAGYDGTFTYCGIAALKPEILKYVKPEGFSSIVTAYEKAMSDGKFIKATCPKDMLWTDAGTIESYVELNSDGDDNAFGEIPQVRSALAEVRRKKEEGRSAEGSSFGEGQGGTSRLRADGASLEERRSEEGKVEFLGARGSDRAFFRCDEGIVILYDDEKRGENARYAGHARWLAGKGIPVPAVLAERPDLKTLMMAWAGEERKMSLEECVKAVEALVKFNALGAAEDLPALEKPFDADLYRWERELFAEHCLGTRFRMEMSAEVCEELENVAALLEREPKALVHRDFQSTNVLWKNGKLCFIDFQGMRLGPAAYDLASFVYDPYATFTEGERRALVKLYAKESGREDIVKIAPYAAVERLVQCLGAYGRLASVGQPQFGKWVMPALENLLAAADEAGLDAVGALAEDLIAREEGERARAGEKVRGGGDCHCGHHHGHGHECHCGK